jgi:hypothetical protein
MGPITMVSNDPISEYMQRHGCSFPEALDALAAQLGRAGAPVELIEALEAWGAEQM